MDPDNAEIDTKVGAGNGTERTSGVVFIGDGIGLPVLMTTQV
jgi:hypothetical protein